MDHPPEKQSSKLADKKSADKKSEDKKSADKKLAPQSGNLVWYMLGLGVLLVLMVTVFSTRSEQTIKWSDFEKLVRASKKTEALGTETPGTEDSPTTGTLEVLDRTTAKPRFIRISQMSEIKLGTHEVTAQVHRRLYKADKKMDGTQEVFTLGEPLADVEKGIQLRVSRDREKDDVDDLLRANNLEWTNAGQPSALLNYLPMLMMTALLVLLFIFMMRRMGGAGSPMAFGRSRGKLYAQEDLGITFDDVAGIEEAVDELREVVEFLQTPEKYRALGGRIPKGVLLVGPPGTGKTLLAKAVAGEADVPFYGLSGSDFVEMFVGVGAARVRDMFQQAEQRAPCIIFIDELDALGKTRGAGNPGGHDEREQTLNALLVEMDGFGTNSGVIVMAASNRPETLDPALLRPGRFDRHVLVDRPDIGGREAILRVHLTNIKVDAEVDVKSLAAITSGFVGADLANVVNEAALLAARSGKDVVMMEDFNEAVERTTAGLEKKSRIMHEDEKRRVAYHEAGHALVACSLPNTDPVHKVSIIPRGLAALGYTMQRPEQDRFLMTQSELESRIQVLLGGTIAEELILEDISSGAQNDLERATEIARSMVMDYGMSRLGRVNFRGSNSNVFLATAAGTPTRQHHSEQTAREIDQEVKRIIDEGLERTRHILETRKEALEAIAAALIKQEVIDTEELAQLIEESSPSPMIVPGTDAGDKRPTTSPPSTETTSPETADG